MSVGQSIGSLDASAETSKLADARSQEAERRPRLSPGMVCLPAGEALARVVLVAIRCDLGWESVLSRPVKAGSLPRANKDGGCSSMMPVTHTRLLGMDNMSDSIKPRLGSHPGASGSASMNPSRRSGLGERTPLGFKSLAADHQNVRSSSSDSISIQGIELSWRSTGEPSKWKIVRPRDVARMRRRVACTRGSARNGFHHYSRGRDRELV
jgi:hypothetical protein